MKWVVLNGFGLIWQMKQARLFLEVKQNILKSLPKSEFVKMFSYYSLKSNKIWQNYEGEFLSMC